ncbi:MAG: M48 family metallopeptidase, partial [Opitutaceae bacterium]|nr:M48 family metallopeptidase [Opitutaceae bacterium]
MDFFQAQDRARGRTSLLVAYFAAAVVGIIAVLYVVAFFVFHEAVSDLEGPEFYTERWQFWDPKIFGAVALGTVAVIGLGSLFKTLALRAGGGAVAESLGGTRIAPHTTDLRERRLVNVVEEMAIASGVRVPAIYVLPDEQGINAFAAGWTPDDAAVAVTRGALETLSRDELQGVIAHEFSHILNGDMRLNIRLIGLLFGIMLLVVIGRSMLRSMRFAGRSSGKGKGGHAGILLLGLAIMLVGLIGVFFGRLIQAAVSRQREFLADASAVQFTRNPAGITGALKKIGGSAFGSRLGSAHATESSHLFFANALVVAGAGPWATHPPLLARIRAIEPTFDGRFPAVQAGAAVDSEHRTTSAPARPTAAQPPPLRPEQFVAALVAGAEAAPTRAQGVLAAIPDVLRAAAHGPESAPALLLGLLAHALDEATAARERRILEQALGAAGMIQALQFARSTASLGDETRLALVDLTLPAIRQLAPATVSALLAVIDEMIGADYRTSPFEFALARIIRRALASADGSAHAQTLPSFAKAPLPDVAAL